MTRGKARTNQWERGGLMKDVELAIGTPVMVTLNIFTDLDVANGVQGEIVGIVLDKNEGRIHSQSKKTTSQIKLLHPPQYVLVKLTRTKAPLLDGLQENVIPIKPVTKSFSVNMDGMKVTVNRRQIPLTPTYTFTDYRSQGQTLEPVIVDIAPPPHSQLTPFNVYVALSRGTGRDHI